MKLKFDRGLRCVKASIGVQTKKKKIKIIPEKNLYKYLTNFHLLNRNRTDALSVFQNVVSLYFSQSKKKKNNKACQNVLILRPFDENVLNNPTTDKKHIKM